MSRFARADLEDVIGRSKHFNKKRKPVSEASVSSVGLRWLINKTVTIFRHKYSVAIFPFASVSNSHDQFFWLETKDALSEEQSSWCCQLVHNEGRWAFTTANVKSSYFRMPWGLKPKQTLSFAKSIGAELWSFNSLHSIPILCQVSWWRGFW